MKICVISSTVFPCPPSGYSGLELVAWLQARGLATLGHEVCLVAPQGSWCPGVQVIPTGPPGGWDEGKAYSTYWQHLLQFDVILDHSWQKCSYQLKMEGRLKAPVLGWMHAPVNTMYQILPQVEKPCFVCISQDQANHFEALHSQPARVCYNGVDPDYYKQMDGVTRTNRFLFLARFSTIKGPDLAIEACRKAEVGLDLVGDTQITGEPEFLEKCKRMCDGKQIRMVGPASRGECVWWFSQSHCLLHPNQRFREPFGLAPIEAQCCGVPVITWNYGAMRETVKHLETGFLCKSLDDMVHAINWAKEDDFLGSDGKVRARCREWASQFSVGRMVKRCDELCKEAAAGGW